MIPIRLQHRLDRLQKFMQTYARLSRRGLDEVIERYGRDLGVKLYQGFSAIRWGAGGDARGSALAFAELAQRAQAGRGTRLRGSLFAAYLRERATLRDEARALRSAAGPLTRREFRRNARAQLRNIRQRVHLWRRFVGREARLRGRGVGVLAASFLWYRQRSNNARGTFLVPNRTGRPLGSVERTEDALVIRGFTPGLDVMDAREGIVAAAIDARIEDTRQHIRRRYGIDFPQEAGLGAL